MIDGRSDAVVRCGDCNAVLREDIFPAVLANTKNRALCILDPYGVHLDWQVLFEAGRSGRIEIFLNFSTFDMQRNVFRHNPDTVSTASLERMNRFWGDETWKPVVYTEQPTLFGPMTQKDDDAVERLIQAFRQRLQSVAGFGFVPEPVPMKNSKNGVIYQLFYAAPKTKGGEIGQRIVRGILEDYRKRGLF